MFAQLGNIVFKNLKSFSEFGKSGSVNYAEHKPIVGKPLLQPTGSNLDEINLSMRFHASFCKPANELNQLKKYQNDNKVLPLLSGNGILIGNFVITSITETIEDADSIGNIFSYLVNCTLREFITVDKIQAQKNANRDDAKAVGDKKPVAKKKKNQALCAQSITNIVTSIENHGRTVNKIVLEKGGANSALNINILKINLDSIVKLCANLITRADDPENCAHNYPDIKTNATFVKNAASTFIIEMDHGDLFRVPPDNALLQSRIKGLKAAASPLVKKSITGQ